MFVVFKVTEADPETCIPQVSEYKVAFLQELVQKEEEVLVRLKLRDDFMPQDQDEEEFMKLQASGLKVEGEVTGYLGRGVYLHSLSQFVESFVQITDNVLRKKCKAY